MTETVPCIWQEMLQMQEDKSPYGILQEYLKAETVPKVYEEARQYMRYNKMRCPGHRMRGQ